MLTKENYKKYKISRTGIKVTSYERINTGRRKRAEENPLPAQPMTEEELDTAYRYRQRAKREHLLCLADVNFAIASSVFVTLTFRENLQDYDLAVKEFKLFTKRLRRKLDDLLYIATIETQQRGAYHFHMMVNCESVQFVLDNLVQCWHNGVVDAQVVEDTKSVMLYITKDMVCQGRNHPLYGKRCYFLSQGLVQYDTVTTWNSTMAEVREVESLLQNKRPIRSNTVNSTKAGLTEYADYRFSTDWYQMPVVAKLKA